MSSSKYLQEAIWAQEIIINHLANDNNQLPIRIDCDSGEVLDPELMVNDLGDFAQYTYLTGKLTSHEKYINFALESAFYAASKYQLKSGLFKNVYADHYNLDWYSSEDTFYGFSSLFYLSENGLILDILNRYKKGIETNMHSSGLLYGATKGLKKYVSRTPVTFVESLVHIYKKNNDVEYLNLAKKLVEPWIRSDFFYRFGLFPDNFCEIEFLNKINNLIQGKGKLLSRINLFSGNCSILKNNSNLIQGILELWKVTQDHKYLDVMEHWIFSVENYAKENNRYGDYNVFTKKYSFFNKPMYQSIHVLGFYADFCAFKKDKTLAILLERSLDQIISQQTETGFFRVEPENSSSKKYHMGWLDQQTDISVILLKGYVLSGKNEYLNSVIKCIDAIIFYLKRPFGYLEYFDPETGESTFHTRLYTKFLTLFPKALILLDAVLNKKDIFKGDFFLITGDR